MGLFSSYSACIIYINTVLSNPPYLVIIGLCPKPPWITEYFSVFLDIFKKSYDISADMILPKRNTFVLDWLSLEGCVNLSSYIPSGSFFALFMTFLHHTTT